MRKIKCLFACLTFSLAAFDSQAQEARWVADDLETYVRSGPTNEYRIVGTLTSGDEVTVLETQGDYTRVQTPDGDEVWIKSDQLQADRSVSERVPELQTQVEKLSTRLEGVDEEWQSRVATMTQTLQQREEHIAELEHRNAELSQQASQAMETIRGLQARLDTQEQDLLMRYFMYGGGVAGAGLIIGLLVPHLPRRRKKRDRWF